MYLSIILVRNNRPKIVPKKPKSNRNPKLNMFKSDGSNGLSGNLPTPINALKTSLIKNVSCHKHYTCHKC